MSRPSAPAGDGPAAVVLQASGPNALGIVRSLGRAGVRVVACDHDPRALGLLSRYATPAHTADPLAEPGAFVDDLLRVAEREPGAVLFATHDEAIGAIGPREAEVDAVLRRPWSPWAAMRGIMDKGHQHAAAHAAGFPVPATLTPADEADLGSVAGHLRFPVILKPRDDAPGFRRRFRAQVLEAVDAEGLRAAWELAAPYRPQVSEVIPGDDSRLWTLGSYRDEAGRPLASFTGRKLRQWPPRFGTARAAESRWDPGLAARCHGLLDALGFHGISQVEVKRDDRDGRDYLIEVNPRSWLWVGLATSCGVNLPYACWLDAVGHPRTWPPGHRGGRRWVLASKHLAGSARELRRGEWSLRPFLSSLRPPISDGVIDPRDPRPAVALYSRIARRRRA